MTASRNSTLRLAGLFILAFSASLLVRLTFSHGTVHAISGAATSFYPDLNPDGTTHDIQAIVQIVSTSESNWATKMKARTTLANLYVPQSMIGQLITIKIVGGCDGSPRDDNWWNGASTTFFMATDASSPLATSKDCGLSANKDIIYSFIAQATTNPAPIQDTPGGPLYYIQTLQADATGVETGRFSLRYLNAFQIDASLTPGVFAGISTNPVPCFIFAYPRSCPPANLQVPLDVNGNPMTQTSYSYSSFYGASSPTSLQADVKLGCSGGKGQLFVYDLDSNDSSLGQNLVLSLKDSNGGSVSVSDQAFITSIGGGNNQVIPFPIPQLPQYGYPSFNYASGVNYTFRIDGLSVNNAFQILPTYYPTTCGPPPSCNITSIVNLTRGGSAFYPNDQIGFYVDLANIPAGDQMGANSYGADGNDPNAGVYGNYLVPANGAYVRTPVPSGNTNGFLVTGVQYNGSGGYSGINAPGSPGGPFSFNWGIVGSAWENSCNSSFSVSAPMVTIQGSFLNAEDIFADRSPFAGIGVNIGCNGAVNIVTNTVGDGSFRFSIAQGATFCVSPASLPAHALAAYTRPYAVGYGGSCPGSYGNYNPNYCAAGGNAYVAQTAGVDNNNGFDRWFGNGSTYDYGYDFAFVIADTASCSAMTITNLPSQAYPNNLYRVTYSFVNTGGKTWIPGQWNSGYHGWNFPGINTNHYLSNGNPGYDLRIPELTGAVGPGGTATFQQDIQTPSVWPDGASYPLEYRMVRDAGPPNGSGGYWFPDGGSNTCATTIGVGQGHLFETFNTAKNVSGLVETCRGQVRTDPTASGGTGGWFSFVVRKDDYFCVRADTSLIGASDRANVYPYGEGYGTTGPCAAGTWCSGVPSYECQGMTPNVVCGTAPRRVSRLGFDIGLSTQPIVTCTGIGISGTINVGDSYNGPAGVSSGGGTRYAAPSVNGTATAVISPVPPAGGLTPTNTNSGAIVGLAQGGTASTALAPPITFTQAGTYNFAGNFAWSGGGYGSSAGCPSASVIATETPYMRFYGNDISAGSGFKNVGGTCTGVSTESIITKARFVNGAYRGSGTQLGAFANGSIVTNGFLTLAQQSADPGYTPTIRAFSNIATAPGPGNYGANVCAPDYWSSQDPTRITLRPGGTISITGLGNGQYSYPNGTIMTSSSVSNRIAVYIDGNVAITDNITSASTSWTDVAQIPSLYLIVRGNIYISANVSQLDGVYVAQPKSGITDSGRIYTCSDGAFATPSNATIVSAGAGGCGQKNLVVNGSFVAQHVNFLRTKGTLRNGAVGGDPFTSANIAEIFRYTPETYMATPLAPNPINGSGALDSIIGLPPSL